MFVLYDHTLRNNVNNYEAHDHDLLPAGQPQFELV